MHYIQHCTAQDFLFDTFCKADIHSPLSPAALYLAIGRKSKISECQICIICFEQICPGLK